MDEKFVLHCYEDVINYVTQKHIKQVRKFSMAPYVTHPIAVACLVMKYKTSHKIDAIVVAALIHDVVEDTDTTFEEIQALFGLQVMSLAQELTSSKDEIKRLGKALYLAQKMTEMSSWGLVVKLCDRLHNCMDFLFADRAFVEKYTKETLFILEYIECHRYLSSTHRLIIIDILKYIALFEKS